MKLTFESVGGQRVFCVVAEPSSPLPKIVIMAHGFKGTSIGPARQFVDFSRLLIEAGYTTLRFDQPGSGNSEGDFIDTSFTVWLNTIEHFAKRYLDLGYEVTLLGQSMGATAVAIAANRPILQGKIKQLLLWAPGTASTFTGDPDTVYEESGQQYKGSFWQEVKDANFFGALKEFTGMIHLAYGENDRFISADLRKQVINVVTSQGGASMILPGQDHSPWDYDSCQRVFSEELELMQNTVEQQ